MAIAVLLAGPAVSSAETFSGLADKGFTTGKLTKSAGGSQGWVLSNGQDKYFCTMRATMAYTPGGGLVSFTSSGRQVKIDRKAFEKVLGGPDKTIPQLSDLNAGKPKPRDVGACVRMRK